MVGPHFNIIFFWIFFVSWKWIKMQHGKGWVMTNYNKLHHIPFPQFHSNPFEWTTSISIQLSLMSTTTKPLVIAFNGLLMNLGRKTTSIHFKCIFKKIPCCVLEEWVKCFCGQVLEWNWGGMELHPLCNFV